MNLSDSKKGKKDREWIVRTFFDALSKHTAFSVWWKTLDQAAQNLVLDDIYDGLRERI